MFYVYDLCLPTYVGDVSSPTWPEPVSYLYSLSPGLLAPVSVARVDLMGDTPGTSSAADTGKHH